MLQYNVSISASLYASYYFELRTLCEKAERTFSLKPLSEEGKRALEARSEGAAAPSALSGAAPSAWYQIEHLENLLFKSNLLV